MQSLDKTVWRFFRKTKTELPYDSAIPLLNIYPEKNMARKDTHTTTFITSLLTIAKT